MTQHTVHTIFAGNTVKIVVSFLSRFHIEQDQVVFTVGQRMLDSTQAFYKRGAGEEGNNNGHRQGLSQG